MRATQRIASTGIPGVSGVGVFHSVESQPLFAWLHAPESGQARGSVLVASAMGREGASSFRTVRALGMELARRGYLAVRFGWRGEGESDDLPSDDVAAHWQRDLEAARGLAVELLPDAPVHGVGLRLGATLLSRVPLTGLRILWEPVSGARYLREHSLLRRVSIGTPVTDVGVEIPGRHYSPEAVAAVGGIAAPTVSDVTDNMLLIREECREERRLLFAGAPHETRIPREKVTAIIDELPVHDLVTGKWTAERLQTASSFLTPRYRLNHTTIGGRSLPAVVSRPVSGKPRCVVLFTGAGAEPMGGPTGLWSVLSRELSEAGAVCVRAERSGQGDFDDCTAPGEVNPYREEAVQDCVDLIDWAREHHRGTAVHCVGLCVGGWLWSRAATLRDVDSVVLMNPVGWHPSPSRHQKQRQEHWWRRLMSERAGIGEDPSVSPGGIVGRGLKRRIKVVCKAVLQSPVTNALALRVGLADDARPALARMRCRVDIHIGPEDRGRWEASGGPAAVSALQRAGRPVQVAEHPDLDHSLLGLGARITVRRIVLALVQR